MGLFDHSPSARDLNISINLDPSCKGTCYPGKQLYGTITIINSVQSQIRSARVELSGNATTHTAKWISTGQSRRRIDYKDEAQLFSLKQRLLESATSGPSQPLECPFSFQFPGTAILATAAPYKGDTRYADVDPCRPLDSYAHTDHALPATFSHYKDEHFYAKAEYGLRVVISFEDRPKPFESEITYLEFCSFRKEGVQVKLRETPNPPDLYASSRLVGQEKSIRHSLRDHFSSKDPPSVKVRLRAIMPVAIASGSKFHIEAVCDIDNFSTPEIRIPEVKLEVKKIQITPTTTYRAFRGSTLSVDLDEVESSDRHEVPLPLPISDNPVIVTKRIAPNGTTWTYPADWTIPVSIHIPPTFTSFNMKRTYRMEVVVGAEVCGRGFEQRLEEKVAVVGVDGLGRRTEARPEVPGYDDGGEGGGGEEPPPYEGKDK